MKELKSNEINNVVGGTCECYCKQLGNPVPIFHGRVANKKACQALCIGPGKNFYQCT